MSYALGNVSPGDTVMLADGTYPGPFSMTTRSGTSGHYITIRATNPGMAKLVVSGQYSALNLKDVSWIRIEGLDCQAAQDHGIQSENSHHIQVVGNTCHNCGGSGIALNFGDYYLVETNTVFNNCATNTYQTSGISIYQARAISGSASGFHIYIRRNMIYGNLESASIGIAHTEGNGIIIDDAHNSQSQPGSSTAGNYSGSMLIENNLVTNNGGDGILVYESDNVTVRHNTVAFNNTDTLNSGTWRGELANSQGRNNHWYNNIAVCNTATNVNRNALLDGVTGGFQNTGTAWIGNLLFDTNAPARSAVLIGGASNQYTSAMALTNNPLRSDPKFALTPTGGNAGSFRLLSGSPAINAAQTIYANTVDYFNATRSLPDVGAIEA